MSLENGNGGMYMPVGPLNGGYGNGFGGDFGGGLFWIIVLFLFAMMGGWNGGFGGNGAGTTVINNDLQRGFDQQAMMTGINGINSAIASLAQGQCSGFAGVTAAVNQGFANAEVSNNARQMADMQQNFAAQTAVDSRLDTLAMSLQQCCCDNRAAVADLKYTIANESANNRLAVQNGVQAILDKMCQNEIENLKTQNANLQNQLNMASFNESQASQNNYLQNALTAQTQYFLSLYPPTAAAARNTATTTTAG